MDEKQEQKIFDTLEAQRLSFGLCFADIDNIFEKAGFNYKGDLAIYADRFDHVVLWFGWNEEAGLLYQRYVRKYRLYYSPASLLLYLSSGKTLHLPLVSPKYSSRKNFTGYKRDHWLPTSFKALD